MEFFSCFFFFFGTHPSTIPALVGDTIASLMYTHPAAAQIDLAFEPLPPPPPGLTSDDEDDDKGRCLLLLAVASVTGLFALGCTTAAAMVALRPPRAPPREAAAAAHQWEGLAATPLTAHDIWRASNIGVCCIVVVVVVLFSFQCVVLCLPQRCASRLASLQFFFFFFLFLFLF